MRVLFFGPVRERLGADHLDVDIVGEGSVENLWTGLIARFPELKSLRPTTRLARGGEFIEPDARLSPGDEIVLIPPVSGG